MPIDYIPDHNATAGDPWNVAFLSDRDVSGQVPINYVPHPGVFLTAACFSDGTYDDDDFKECFSNLLASEIRRFVVDVYWDVNNRRFRLCPVELPLQQNASTAAAASMPLMTNQVNDAVHMSTMVAPSIARRQTSADNATTSSTSVQDSATVTATSTTLTTSIPTSKSSSGSTLYQIGPYTCSNRLGFDTLLDVLSDYIGVTSYETQARLQYIMINLHAASTIEEPTAMRQDLAASDLPNPDQLISTYVDQVDSVLYTPVLLHNERQNLNSSWFLRHTVEYYPLLKYFTVTRLPTNDLATQDGWPNENYLELEQGFRLLIGFDFVSPEMSQYNFAGDGSRIFPPGYLSSPRSTTLDSSGSLTMGCYYSSTEQSVSQVNSSWAVSSVMNIDQSILGFAADNLTVCGISPILNFTLDNQPASTNYEPYQTFGNQALFSWASGEPGMVDSNNDNGNGTGEDIRLACALLVANDSYKGHWRASNCNDKHRVACRQANLPYVWSLSTKAVLYDGGTVICDGNSTFDVPRTGLENLYLYQHVQAISTAQDDSSLLNGVWINFNSLDVESCWITTGPNGTCPYAESADIIQQRKVLVPTIAGIITFCLTALTMLVKCNINRRNSKVRRRGEGGWDYEGVPS